MVRLTLNLKSCLHKFLVKPYLMNISTSMRRQLYQGYMLIQHTQIDNKNAEKKSLAKVLQSKDTVLINDLDDEIINDEQYVRKVTASEVLDSLDAVKCFAEIHRDRDKQMNVMLYELIGKVETPKLQNVRQSTIHMFLRN